MWNIIIWPGNSHIPCQRTWRWVYVCFSQGWICYFPGGYFFGKDSKTSKVRTLVLPSLVGLDECGLLKVRQLDFQQRTQGLPIFDIWVSQWLKGPTKQIHGRQFRTREPTYNLPRWHGNHCRNASLHHFCHASKMKLFWLDHNCMFVQTYDTYVSFPEQKNHTSRFQKNSTLSYCFMSYLSNGLPWSSPWSTSNRCRGRLWSVRWIYVKQPWCHSHRSTSAAWSQMKFINMLIYVYPRGGRFTGNSCPKGVYIYEVGVGLGWGGVGMITFLALAHMVGATQVMGWGGVGVGWGGDDNVPFSLHSSF